MSIKTELDKIYILSEEVVSREIEGELIIVPLTGGIGDMEEPLYSLNETGKAIWGQLNGEKRLEDIVSDLTGEYGADRQEIETDVVGLIRELVKRQMVRELTAEK